MAQMNAPSLTFTDASVCGVPVVHVRYGLVDIGRINKSGYLAWSFQPDLSEVDGFTAEQMTEIANWIKHEQPA